MSTVDKRREPYQINDLIADVKDLVRILPRLQDGHRTLWPDRSSPAAI